MPDPLSDQSGPTAGGDDAFEALLEAIDQPAAIVAIEAGHIVVISANRPFQRLVKGVYVARRSRLARGPEGRLLQACRQAADGPTSVALTFDGAGDLPGLVVSIGAGRFALTLRPARATAADAAVSELKRRLRSTLATVRSIVRRSSRSSRGLDAFVGHLEGRIGAVARSQVLLIATPGLGADLETLLRSELRAQGVDDAQVAIDGPGVRLSPAATDVLALAFHELIINAIKFGPFAAPEGRATIDWEVEDEGDAPHLRLVWSEGGGSSGPAGPPGFGWEVITRRLPYELNGSGAVKMTPHGLRVEIVFPIVAGEGKIVEPTAPQGGVQ